MLQIFRSIILILTLLPAFALAETRLYFGAQEHVFDEDTHYIYNDVTKIDHGNFAVDTAEAKLQKEIENDAVAKIDLKIARMLNGRSVYRVIEQTPLTLIHRRSLSRALSFKRFEVRLQTRYEAKTLTFSNYYSEATPTQLVSFGVDVVDEKNRLFLSLEKLSPDELNVDPKFLTVRARPWLTELIRQKFRDANRLSVRDQLYVRLRMRGMRFEEVWELSKEELLDFLSLKYMDRWFFGCNKSLRGNRRRTASEIIGE